MYKTWVKSLGSRGGKQSTAKVGLLLTTVLALSGCSSGAGPNISNPLVGLQFYSDQKSSAAQSLAYAKKEHNPALVASLGQLAQTPTAIWLTPEKYPLRNVERRVDKLLKKSVESGKTAILVVYGVPNRDCENYSSGGLSAQLYPRWVRAISRAISGRKAVVILEPDALALTEKCQNEAQRVSEIRSDIAKLKQTAAITYVDIGHSSWLSSDEAIRLLKLVGVDRIQGFALNVSNYNLNQDERNYGQTISQALAGAHYVIDTSRNGNGSDGNWCNPAGRMLGELPAATFLNGSQDAGLWIKPPGESDGYCGGGPKAGRWWPERAKELLTASGW